MRLVFIGVLLLGLGLAGFAVYNVNQYITQTQTELAQAREHLRNATPQELGTIVLSRKTLRYGERISPEDVAEVSWPKTHLPVGAFTSIDEMFPNNVSHRTVLRSLEPREPIMLSKLTEPGTEAGITSHLSPGRRAFTIQVNVTTGVSGFLRPGDFVDVFWTGRTQATGEITRMIDSRLRLIAVDQSADMDGGSRVSAARNITVEATPAQAAALAQAQSTGRLSLALVGHNDQTIAGKIEVDQNSLLGIIREDRTVETQERCQIRTRRGNDLVMIDIPCTN